jgi:hypothetical protein
LAKRRIIRDSVFNENVIGSDFQNTPSTTIFRLGNFTLDTNLESRVIGDFSNRITTFSKEYTLENIGINETTSEKIFKNENKLRLNIDYNEITSYSRYGSIEDLFKFTVKNIIKKFPYSLRAINQLNTGIVNTVLNFTYDELEDISTFRIPTITLINIYGIIVDSNNNKSDIENPLKNFNLSKEKYVIWSSDNPDIEYPVVDFIGNSTSDSFITLSVKGKLFNINNTTLSKTFHIKPSNKEFLNFLFDLNDIEKYILNKKNNIGFSFKLKDIKEDGRTFYTRNFVWPTSDDYNIDLDTISYNVFLSELINLGLRYDEFKTDTIYRLYTTDSLKEFDSTNDQKIKKIIRTYGFEFDKIRRLADGFATLNNLSYKKEKSIPDILIKNLAKTLGWEVFDIVKEDNLLNKIFNVGTSDVSQSLIPSEIDIELWRRILVNTKWFFKSKGTRKSFETIFKLIGIPEQFILLNEYIYLAENKLELDDRILSINRSTVLTDLETINPSSFDDNGYPIAVPENIGFYFQLSGNTDNGQTYLNRFRENGFVINDTVDNKKSWITTDNNQTREEFNTSYNLNDSRLIINTKEIDIGLSPSRALENNVFEVNKILNYPICGTGVTNNVLYINLPLNVKSPQQTVFDIPDIPEGDIQVTVNGIVLTINDDYILSGTSKNRIVLQEPVLNTMNGVKDIISVTYVNNPFNNNVNIVEYIVLKIGITENNQTIITLPEESLGDIQLVLNGFTLKQGKINSEGDFYINPNNRKQIIITSNNINNSLKITDTLTVMFFKEINSNDLLKYSDNHIITSFFNNKLYFNNISNRYIYVADYVILNVNSIKVTLNGITLTNGSDFTIDPLNKTKIIFSPQIILAINDIINVFYIIDTNPVSNCIDIGGNIYQMSFTEYIDKTLNNLIDVKNRKIITDNNGGTYPKLSFLYDSYRKSLKGNNILLDYNFNNLFSYIKKFDNHFINLLNQLLPATTITRKSGLIISNSIYSQQKYKYIRGINDGSEFIGENERLTCDLFDFNVIKTDAKSTENLGTITINPTGFNGYVEYSIDGEFFLDENKFTDLLPGEYNITVKDEIGCEITGITNINLDCSDFYIDEINIEDIKSDTELGSIQINVSGDTNVLYSIDNGVNFKTGNTFTDLIKGNYDIFVKSSLGCIISGITRTVGIDCDVSISDFTYGSCEATGFLNRDGSSLTIVNNELALFMNYNFDIDTIFNRYFREKIIITETTTSQIILEQWVNFIIEPNRNNKELGNIFLYNLPTYQTFEFDVSYTGQTISCTPFTEPVPEPIFTPLPEEPVLTYELTAIQMGEEYQGSGSYEITLGLQISNPLQQNITATVKLNLTDNSSPDFISSQITIQQGSTGIQTISGSYTNSTGSDNTIFGPICVVSFTYIGPETIILTNECE